MNYENGKFSKSRNVGVFGTHMMDTGILPSVWRYYLISSRPETADASFSWTEFVTRNNSELLANFGNFVNRVGKFVVAKYNGIIPDSKAGWSESETRLIHDVNVLLQSYNSAMEATKLRLGLKLMMDISSLGNSYLQDSRLDSTLYSTHRSRCDTVVNVAMNLVYLLSSLCHPFMPQTTETIEIMCNFESYPRLITNTWSAQEVKSGHEVGEMQYLFKRIEESTAEEMRIKYSGVGGGGSIISSVPTNTTTTTTSATTSSKTTKEKSTSSSGGKSDKKSKKSSSSATQPAPLIPEGVERTPELIDMENKIKIQGDKIREMKSQGKDKNTIMIEVETLKSLKLELTSKLPK